MTRFCKRFDNEIKKINKNKKLDLKKGMSLVFERKRFIDNIC